MASTVIEHTATPWRKRLNLPAYRISDAAVYARTAPQTVSYWHHRGGELGAALPGREKRRHLSYLELVEVAYVATFRELGVPLQRIRQARSYAAEVLDSRYPFAEFSWFTEGLHLLVELSEVDEDAWVADLVVGDRHGQIAWKEMMGERFAQFDYVNDLALTWHVRGRDNRVTIDPRVSFGVPSVNGIPTWVIKGRSSAGESVEDICGDLGLSYEDIRDALVFEGIQPAA